jgi:pimeloyl-ACP methyl ester carboxylesterase
MNEGEVLDAMPAKPSWLADQFPWPQRRLAVNGRTMAYLDEGARDAAPVLLLHGNPTWSFLYRDFVRPLVERGYRVIAPDWIGSGYSSKPRIDAAHSLAHHIADLVSFIDQLALKRMTIVAQDWGGPQGLGAALQRPSALKALVLMNTWAFTHVGSFHRSPRPWTTWHAPLVGPVLMKRFKVLSHGGPSTIAKRRMTRTEKRGYHHIYDEPDSETVVLTWPRTIPLREGDRGWADMKAIEDRLHEFSETATLIVWGTDDPVFDVSYRDRLKQLFPHAEGPVNFDRASHFLQDDRGADIVGAMLPFLDRWVKDS